MSSHGPRPEVPVRLEPFERRLDGRPMIPATPAALYGFGALIRACEELVLDLFRRNLLSGTAHTCLGQELCQIAVVRALSGADDLVFSNHRGHGHFLAHTGDFAGLLTELMGRAAGACKGMGGSQHLGARGFRSSGVQAGLTAVAVGEALARRRQGSDAVAAVFVGDGTLGEGLLYESLNLAAIWRVPVLFVVEDNGIAQTTPTAAMIGGGSIRRRGEAFGLRSWSIADTDPRLVAEAEAIVAAVRRDGEPGFLVVKTARLGPHSKGDDTRSEAELAALRARDPLTRLGETLAPAEKRRIDDANAAFLEEVYEAALASPPARFQGRPRHIFARAPAATTARQAAPAATAEATVRGSLNAALRRMLSSDARTILIGQDLHDPYGGAFKVTAGLSTAFPDRVLSTPISEAALVGAGVGLALAGSRPIVEIMFADFLALAADQLLNHAVKFAGLPGTEVPLVVRTPSGGRRGYGPTHSQSTESLAALMPGLTVVAPSHRHDPGRLLQAAVQEWPYPTVFFEHKLTYALPCGAGEYRAAAADREDPAAALFPTLVKGAETSDVTLVTYGGMTPTVEAVVARLEAEEIVVRTVIVSLIAPLPRLSLGRLLTPTCPRVVVVEEGHSAHGVGAELGAMLLETGYAGRFARIGASPVPIPAARSLESDVIPGETFIFDEVAALFS